jgi:hypothetical protein
MLRNDRPLIGLFLPIALVGLFLFASTASAQRERREAVAFTPPNLSLVADQQVITVCDGAGPAVVRLNARATSSYPISYRWAANAGRIEGDGATVTWDLSGAQPGRYRANVDIDTGSGDELCQAFSSTTVLVKRCPPPVAVCPNVVVHCPPNVVLGEPVTFTSSVSGGSTTTTPVYNWTVSAGSIIEGQGTSSIRVNTTGLAGQTLTATLSMDGYGLECSASCPIQFPVPVECQKFDEYPNISRNDEKARLDNYGIKLADPTLVAYVIVYPGQGGRPGDVERHITRVTEYLENSRGISGQRIVTLVGPVRSELTVELWTCPQGAKPPVVPR